MLFNQLVPVGNIGRMHTEALGNVRDSDIPQRDYYQLHMGLLF